MAIKLSSEYHAVPDERFTNTPLHKCDKIPHIPENYDVTELMYNVGYIVMDYMPGMVAPLEDLLYYLSPLDPLEVERVLNEASAEGFIILTDDPIPTVQFAYCTLSDSDPRYEYLKYL